MGFCEDAGSVLVKDRRSTESTIKGQTPRVLSFPWSHVPLLLLVIIMLVLHPTSRCDICLDDYTWVTPKHSPHAIACGHIFCLMSVSSTSLFTSTSSFTFYIRCLEQLQPSTCPLCRKHFQPNKVKKLHVDRVPDEPDGSNRLLDSHSNVLLQRIAMVSGDRAPDADVAEVITEVFQWLENESDALNAVSATSFVNYPSFIPTHARTEPTP